LSFENQKKVYEAEQKFLDQRKREEEAALEIAKEREMMLYEVNGDISQRDPRTSSLKFMYSQPSNKSKEDQEEEEQGKTKNNSQYLGHLFAFLVHLLSLVVRDWSRR
jgi:sulfur relay (sulfurtransferase) DsrC/TusE family protein